MSVGRQVHRLPHCLLIVLAVSVAAAAAFTLFAASDGSDAEYAEFTQDGYDVSVSTNTGVVTIHSYNGSDTEVVMPDYFTYKDEKYYVEYFSPDIFNSEGGLRSPCKTITSLTFPSEVWNIDGDWSIFTKLETVSLGPAVKYIEISGFVGSVKTIEEVNVDPGNSYFSSEDGVLFSKTKSELLFYPVEKQDPSFTIPAETTILDVSSKIYSNTYLKSVDVEAGNVALSSSDGVLYDIDKKTVLLYPNGKESESFVMPDTVTYLTNPILSSYLTSITFGADFEEATVEIGFADGYLVIPTGSVSPLFAAAVPFTVSFGQVDSPSKDLKDVSPNPYYRLDVGGLAEFSAPLTLKVYNIRYLATNMHVLCVDDDGGYVEVQNVERARTGATFSVYNSGNYTYIFKDTTTIENAPLIAAVIAGVGTLVALATVLRNARRKD